MEEKKFYKCALAQHGIGIGSFGNLIPCCQYKWHEAGVPFLEWDQAERFNTEIRNKILDDFKNGIRNPGCRQCFHEEDMGAESLRMVSNQFLSEINSQDYDENTILDIELNLGNFCNLRCIMCGPYSSSSWEVAYKQNPDLLGQREIKILDGRSRWWEKDGFIGWLTPMLATCRRLDIAGGEPMLIPQTEMVIDELIRLKREKIVRLLFNSNYTKISAKLLEKLKLFENLQISCSIEGVREMNDYLRYPSRWEDIEKNIHLVKDTLGPKAIMVNHTIQHASTYSLPALAEFCRDNNIYLHTTSVQGKDGILSFNSVPPRDLARFVEWAENTPWLDKSIRAYIINLRNLEFDLVLYQQFRDYIDKFDRLNNTNYDSVFNPSDI